MNVGEIVLFCPGPRASSAVLPAIVLATAEQPYAIAGAELPDCEGDELTLKVFAGRDAIETKVDRADGFSDGEGWVYPPRTWHPLL